MPLASPREGPGVYIFPVSIIPVTLPVFPLLLEKSRKPPFLFNPSRKTFSLDTGEGKKYDVNGFISRGEKGNLLRIAQGNQLAGCGKTRIRSWQAERSNLSPSLIGRIRLIRPIFSFLAPRNGCRGRFFQHLANAWLQKDDR